MVLTKVRSVDLFLFKMSADVLWFILDQKSLLLCVRYYYVWGPTCIGVFVFFCTHGGSLCLAFPLVP